MAEPIKGPHLRGCRSCDHPEGLCILKAGPDAVAGDGAGIARQGPETVHRHAVPGAPAGSPGPGRVGDGGRGAGGGARSLPPCDRCGGVRPDSWVYSRPADMPPFRARVGVGNRTGIGINR